MAGWVTGGGVFALLGGVNIQRSQQRLAIHTITTASAHDMIKSEGQCMPKIRRLASTPMAHSSVSVMGR